MPDRADRIAFLLDNDLNQEEPQVLWAAGFRPEHFEDAAALLELQQELNQTDTVQRPIRTAVDDWLAAHLPD